MFFVYVIINLKGQIYIGQTDNLKYRLLRHNSILPTKNNSYTKRMGGPWNLVYKEEFLSRSDAMLRERQLKSYRGRCFIRDYLKTLS